MKVAAIDQGTTSTRVLLFEEGAPPRLVLSLRHRQIFPKPGWVEHDPLELLQNVKACIAAVGPVDAIGIANQGESCLAWDGPTGTPLSPVIVWQDSRTNDRIERMKAQGCEDEVKMRAGLPLDCYFSASKLAWIIDNHVEARAALSAGRLRLGTTDSYFLDQLTGNFLTDPTTASRTSLMQLTSLAWDKGLCEMFGVPMECLATIVETSSTFGFAGTTPIKASVVDQQAALYGHDCRMAGDAKITFGTGAFALAVVGDRPADSGDSGLISTVAWQREGKPTFALEGGVYDVGSVIEWAIRIGVLDDATQLSHFPTGGETDNLIFVPALSGLACPQWDRAAGGLWIGMTTATTKDDMRRSMLEGIALQTRQMMQVLDRTVGLGDRISVDGGLTGSNYFLQFLADCLGKEVIKRSQSELTACGCAMLAGFPGPIEALGSDVAFQPGPPDARKINLYDEALRRSGNWLASNSTWIST